VVVGTKEGWGDDMVQSHRRWPEWPQPWQRMLSRQARTWWRTERQRKHPSKFRLRFSNGARGVAGERAGGHRAASK
jgi:hypothetical protein